MAKILVKIQNIIFSIIKDTRSKGYPKDLLNVQCKEFKKTSPLYDPPQLKKNGEAQLFYEMGEEGLKLKKNLLITIMKVQNIDVFVSKADVSNFWQAENFRFFQLS